MDSTNRRHPSKNLARLLVILISLDLLLGCYIVWDNDYDFNNWSQRIIGTGTNKMALGMLGPGSPSGRGNSLNVDLLQPGDIILGGNNGSTYGRFTHAAIYQEKGYAWDGWLDAGVRQMKVSEFLDYDRACILRVKTNKLVKTRAVSYVAAQKGKLFYPLTFKKGERIWNCTKTIWQAYHRQGIDLDNGEDIWVVPDNLYNSSEVLVIDQSGEI
ncbi:MAG: hypothetical protein ACM3MK_07415 [Chitinophagales bacterium]